MVVTLGPDESGPVDAAEAWKAVGLVNDWVKHAESKAGALMAASGVTGGVLYNLVKSQDHPGGFLAIAATTSAVTVLLAAACALTALWPRLHASEPPTSLLYFEHIARRHPKSPAAYIEEFKALATNPDSLLEQLAQQVWANARVAKRKYFWAGLALLCLAVSLVTLACVALNISLVSIGVING
ncbi:hypothetical protein FHX52_0777 [Humibacillus xanthopallidus]|uniref:Pycsar effector protein domain-containing protein n=1 Tax=Humibacillus xanthopallidus TaxID=412689 RepID=A0A543PUD5_9MICO|nr:Pycsar system effector family protein [Humibacillus xanthopallidus]TQN47670.1 hypothetical protein FHX52_0777 [Humibacillus xanthopallidus]